MDRHRTINIGPALAQARFIILAVILMLLGYGIRLKYPSVLINDYVAPVIIDLGGLAIVGAMFDWITKKELFKWFATQMLETVYLREDQMGVLIKDEMIDRFFRNALKYKLRSPEHGNATFQDLIRPYLYGEVPVFRSKWEYEVKLSNPEIDILLGDKKCLDKQKYYRLLVHYKFTEPASLLGSASSILLAMDSSRLQDTFADSSCAYREVLFLEEEDTSHILASLDSSKDVDFVKQLASRLFRVSFWVNEQRLPEGNVTYESGWKAFRIQFTLPKARPKEVRYSITLESVIARDRGCLPVVISRPTKGPSIRFDYEATDITSVEYFDFITSPNLFKQNRVEDLPARILRYAADINEWIFPASGLVLCWRREAQFNPSPSNKGEKG